ncbi:LOW QUALITY PROTEIN: uncharacterized protein LOC135206044 [Macrobrachium nipponense]|uniref:LOW QUALITY PROTEIN: uncharacterized protein LOC135206044 n=1 Tax=Macrobrachium nipponense TaxID=159736 RepID=UPI0030C86A6D
MKVAIPGRAMKMQEHFGSGPAHLTPLLKHGKIPFNNIQIRPHIDYININNATQSSHTKEDQTTHNNKEWKKTAKLYKKELKSKGNIRPSTAVRQHVKKISEDFTLTQTKYENSVNTTTSTNTKPPEKKDNKSPIKSASSNSSSSSVNQKIPQSKFPKNVLSKITCSKCESISKASRKNVMIPITLPAGTGAGKNGLPKNSNAKCTNLKNKNSLNSQNSNSRCLQELPLHKKSTVSPTEISPRPRLRHSSGRCGGGPGVGAFDFCLAPTSPGLPRSPGRKLSSSLAGISPRSQQVCSEQIRRVKLFTERAILEGRVFSIFGYFPAVKDALRRRGWVEKIQHTVPYVNPHPNNCVCPHVGYQLSFMSPLSAPSTNTASSHSHPHHKTSGSTSKGAGEETKDEQNQEEEEDSEVHGATVDDDDSPSSAQTETVESSPSESVNTDISPSSLSLSVPSPSSQSSSPLESDNKDQRITANLGSSTVETVVPPSHHDVNENKTSSASDNQSDNHSTSDDSKSQESEKSSSAAEEPSDNTSAEPAKNSDHFNTAILGPSEIRKGLAESITEKNAPIFKYSTANIATRKSVDNGKDDDDDEDQESCSQHESGNGESGSQGENASDCPEEEKNDTEEAEEEEKPEPYNPYVDYDLTDSDLPLVARLLRNVEPNFLWTWTRDSISFKHLSREQLVNRFPNTPFTTKYGLCETLQQLHWFSEAAGVDTFVPRGYCIGHEDERTAFIHDYRTTACLNVLKWVTERYGTHGPQAVSDPHGEERVPTKRVRQALAHVEQFIQSCCHDDLDSPPPITLKDHEWDSLIAAHYKIVHMDKKIKISNQAQLQQLVSECESAVERVVPFWPQLSMDGLRNLWIVKPGAQSRGRGIFMMNHLEEILALVQSPLIYETKYVVQKYMERPLLIHNTKFDIRQWFMVTDWNPLHVWVYKECYLRFCSQQYDLTNNNEAIHLSNNAIQCKYLNGERSGELPEENMWDCQQFKEYLRGLKKEHMWDEVIYPGMRDALVAAMLAAQVEMDTFKHGFELFGADFMLTEDLRPWLIEINSSPCMAPTTSVTRRMCAQCLQDVVKVVIDYKHVKTADTGHFELAYRDSEKSIPNPPYLGVNLQVVGRQIKKGPIKLEKRKPKKVKPAPRLVKPLPLITLSLEEGTGGLPPQKEPATTSSSKDATDSSSPSRPCSILDCRRYSNSTTTAATSSESSDEKVVVAAVNEGSSAIHNSKPSPAEATTKRTPEDVSSKREVVFVVERTKGDLSGGTSHNANNHALQQDFRGS